MSIAVGSSLGNYEVTGSLGAGAMGEVYRARDPKLEREVAIKILPEAFAHDRERLDRFEREAKLLAAVKHPAIATIHGFEESNGTRFLVMELVEGETLAERIARGIPLDELLPIFSHRRGARGGTRQGHRPSRSQAAEHQDPALRFGQSP